MQLTRCDEDVKDKSQKVADGHERIVPRHRTVDGSLTAAYGLVHTSNIVLRGSTPSVASQCSIIASSNNGKGRDANSGIAYDGP